MMRGDTYIPVTLSPHNFPFIEQLMLGEYDELQRPSAVVSITPPRALTPVSVSSGTAFVRQINELIQWPEIVQPMDRLHAPPEAFVFVNHSAAPVKFAVQEVYKAYKMPAPAFAEIDASGNLHGATKSIKTARHLGRISHACIIENYSDERTQEKLQLGSAILTSVGIEHVSAIRGRWYHEAARYATKESKDSIKAFMQHIGRLAAGRESSR